MPGKSTKIPKFKSTAAEAEWYATPEDRRQTQREFARALRTGTLSRSPELKAARTAPRILEQLMEQAKESDPRDFASRSDRRSQSRSHRKPASVIRPFSNRRFTRGC